MIVPFMTYDPSKVQAMVNSARILGKPFRVLHYQTPKDVTEQYIKPV